MESKSLCLRDDFSGHNPYCRNVHITDEGPQQPAWAQKTHTFHNHEDAEEYYPVFPILGVFRLNGQSKRDGGIIVRSCKAIHSPVYPIRDAILAVNHASCPSLSSPGSPPVG